MVKMTQPKLYTRGTKLWIRFSLDGKVVKKSLNLEDNKANRKLALNQIIPQMLIKVHSGEFFENKTVPTVKEMIDISLKMHSKSRKKSTIDNYISKFKNYVIPKFGNRKINSIKPSELVIWQNELLDTFSSKYVTTIRVSFNGIFEDALRDEIIDKNPLSLVRTPKLILKRKINPFSKEEIFRILDEAPLSLKAYFAIGFFTGMRTGEILALKRSDIDLEKRLICITKSRNRGVETSPKTQSSIREVDILDVLIPYLEKHLTLKSDIDYLFLSRNNKPFHSAVKISETYWKKLLINLNIEYRNMYQMRHTFASMMISNGEDILWVSNMLGHKNSNMTLSVYAKYIKKEKRVRGRFLIN